LRDLSSAASSLKTSRGIRYLFAGSAIHILLAACSFAAFR
jgi:hypothetical protein